MDDNIIQSFARNAPSYLHSTPLYGDGPDGARVFTCAEKDYLKSSPITENSQELWNSLDDGARDDCGNFAKFDSPTVANGKVYMGSFSRQLCVYGLLE